MKSYTKYISIIIFLLSLSLNGMSQDSTSTGKQEKSPPVETEQIQPTDQTKVPKADFIDNNGNGIDDREENQKKKVDRFIDLDGDGINDGEESAIGLKKAFQIRKRQQQKGK